MKVWIIGRDYPCASNNRLGSFELEQAKILARAGLEVTYLVTDPHSIRRWRRFGFVTRMEEGVTVATASFPVGGIIPASYMNRTRHAMLGRLMRYLGKKKGYPDIIHVHYLSSLGYRHLEPLQKKGVKVVATEHWSRVQAKAINGWLVDNLKQYVLKADAVCCVGTLLEKSVRELTGTRRPIHIIPNALYGEFRPVREDHKGFRFLSIGRMVPVKQYDLLVEAFLDVFKDRPEVTLTMAGNGPEAAKVSQIIRRRNAAGQVFMLGLVPHELIAGLIASSDAFVGFSVLETFCVPAVESWACGKPVIATSTTAVFADCPDERLGIMVDASSTKELKEAFRKMAGHYEQYDPEWICRFADTHFSQRVFLEKQLAVYDEVLGSTGG